MKQLNLEGINILQMQIFITAGTELNYTRTAYICNVTQPTVSRSIDALERALDLKLIYKKSNRMQLTEAGQVIHSCFKENMCELYRNIQIAHDQQQGIGSKLRITYGINSNLTKMIADLGQSFLKKTEGENISIEYKNSSRTEGLQYLLQNRVDVLFAIDLIKEIAEKDKELDYCILLELPLMAYMLRTNALSCKRKLSFQDMEGQELIVQKPEKDSCCTRKLEEWFVKEGIIPHISHYCDFTMEGVMNIQKDNEVLLADQFDLPQQLSHLARVEVENTKMQYVVLWRKSDTNNKVISEYINCAKQFFRNICYSI